MKKKQKLLYSQIRKINHNRDLNEVVCQLYKINCNSVISVIIIIHTHTQKYRSILENKNK